MCSRNASITHDEIVTPVDKPWPGTPQNSGAYTALRVLESARDAGGRALTPVEAATQLGTAGSVADDGSPLPDADGIETLMVFVGSNNERSPTPCGASARATSSGSPCRT